MLYKIIYWKDTGKVCGYVGSSNLDVVNPIVNSETQGVVITDSPVENPLNYFYINNNLQKDYYGSLVLSSDKTDTDADGVEDMLADGISSATYTIQKVDANGVPMSSAGDNETIIITVSRGKLSALNVQLINGAGTFTLTSIEETIPITVTVQHSLLGTVTKQLQLIPPSPIQEHLMLSSNKTDTDADGIEDMPADGISQAIYTIQKVNAIGEPMVSEGDNETITIAASRGILSALNVPLVNGTGTFTLTSIAETILITVTVQHSLLGTAAKQLQLIPVI